MNASLEKIGSAASRVGQWLNFAVFVAFVSLVLVGTMILIGVAIIERI
jgi:hypothetical protein